MFLLKFIIQTINILKYSYTATRSSKIAPVKGRQREREKGTDRQTETDKQTVRDRDRK